MINVYFICGFIGSGKTTYAKLLAKEQGAFRLSMDEWMIPLFGEHMERDVFNDRLATLEKLFRVSALQLIELDVPVIFDSGYWKASDRANALEWGLQNGLACQVHYLDTPFETCKQRAIARNGYRDGKSYEMTPTMLEMFWSWFEEPSPVEDVLRVSDT